MFIPHNEGAGIMFGFLSFWFNRISPVSLIRRHDSCDGSHYVLHSFLSLAVGLNLGFLTFHVVMWAQYLDVTVDVPHSRITPSGGAAVWQFMMQRLVARALVGQKVLCGDGGALEFF